MEEKVILDRAKQKVLKENFGKSWFKRVFKPKTAKLCTINYCTCK